MTSPGRFAVVALGICAASVLIAPGSASAFRVKVGLPKEGATALVVSQVRYVGKLPHKTRVRIKSPSRLPASDRGLYAIYGRQRGRQAIVTVYTILLRQQSAPPAGTSAIAESSDSVESEGAVDIQFAFLAQALTGEKVTFGETREQRTVSQALSKQTPTEPPPKLEDMLKAGGVEPHSGGVENPGFLGKSLLDTGHYDDGHSFGWKSTGTRAAIGDWIRLTGRGDPYGDVIEKIEIDLAADLSGDGAIGDAGSGPGSSIGTEVGPPTIMRLP